MNCRISVIVPNRNGAKTIGMCLEALFRSVYDGFEVIVVDDCSSDDSVAVIRGYPCRLIALGRQHGAAAARNIGAGQSRGELLFFIDADCLVQEDTLHLAEELAAAWGKETVIGGTYTCRPHDLGFYSLFQSLFIHFSEGKRGQSCDYIAGHAMLIARETFRQSGGFPADFLPLIEDVEFSHRLRAGGYRLVMERALQVRHIFNFRGFWDSLLNGFRKSKYWVVYSLANRDLFADSGTASHELKGTVVFWFLLLITAGLNLFYPGPVSLLMLLGAASADILLNRRLFALFYRSEGGFFAARAAGYYLLLYSPAVAVGALVGALEYVTGRRPVLRLGVEGR
ncbi:MAG: glycosyltransferase family 2 protein [Desulfobulbaceae bacterium]